MNLRVYNLARYFHHEPMLLTNGQGMRQCPSFEYDADDHVDWVWWPLYWCSAWLVGNYSSSHNCAQLPSLFCSLQFPSIILGLWEEHHLTWFRPLQRLHCNSLSLWDGRAKYLPAAPVSPRQPHLGQTWAHLSFFFWLTSLYFSVPLDLLSSEYLMRWCLRVFAKQHASSVHPVLSLLAQWKGLQEFFGHHQGRQYSRLQADFLA
jgi:hypothetical protein